MTNITFKPSTMMTFATAKNDWERFLTYTIDHPGKIVNFELKEITHCDSAGLALLIAAFRLCKQNNKLICLENVPQDLYALTDFCGVAPIFFANEVKFNEL